MARVNSLEEAIVETSIEIHNDDSVTIECQVHATIPGLAKDMEILGRFLDSVRELKEKHLHSKRTK